VCVCKYSSLLSIYTHTHTYVMSAYLGRYGVDMEADAREVAEMQQR
jgi:hypothetical protein